MSGIVASAEHIARQVARLLEDEREIVATERYHAPERVAAARHIIDSLIPLDLHVKYILSGGVATEDYER